MAALRNVSRLSLRTQICRFSASQRQLTGITRCLASPEKVTHTGQAFDEGDYRKIRYIDRDKELNEKFAIDLVDEEPPKEVNTNNVWCDGGDPNLGHPKVFINLDIPGPHACGYCGLRYVYTGH
ncbi:NADH dehydrogenase [ubiquinone] iron-sulfur protein 6, mitochondrial-like [Asterias amurensis]|uniref:NADH dehydrogenase [ubiquinone] iron-sulfur protein 6, mitochondrial-like n=1 Tax=Asterias amurensis TaxID=7602 RepID=UPI003AB6A032